MSSVKWKPRKESYQDAIRYLDGRQKGEITSFKTPWEKVNDAGVDGIEWQSMVLLAARSGTGKTVIKDQIINQAFDLNPNTKFRVLDFRFEMVSRVTAIREYSSILGKSYKQLCSAGEILPYEDLVRCHNYSKEKADPIKYPIDIVDEPCTVFEFIALIDDYMVKNSTKEGYTKTFIAVDHALLFKKENHEKSDQDMLSNLGKAITGLKKKYPIIFFILDQLNRNIEQPERNENGKYGNYVLPGDIFGSDCLLHHSDLVIGVNRPAVQKISAYGPDRYIIEDDRVLAWHFIKTRNGDNRISFFKAEFDKMRVVDMITPPMQVRRTVSLTE